MKYRAFSIAELVTVVVIIAIISVIAISRLSRSTQVAAEAALWSNLQTLRKIIDMYSAEHGGILPGSDSKERTLIDQLSRQTDFDGNIGATPNVHIYGPYLHRGFPPVPVGRNAGATGVIMKAGALKVDEKKKEKGWVYNYKSGAIVANTNGRDAKGVRYKSY